VAVEKTVVIEQEKIKDTEAFAGAEREKQVKVTLAEMAAQEDLVKKIKEAEAVIVLPSLYEEKQSLARFLMDAADANSKPMIAIRPFGGLLETPPAVVERVREHIEWNDREIADSLRRQARGEDTARWETIDFPGWDEHGEIEDNT
jgi:hypothetical protein